MAIKQLTKYKTKFLHIVKKLKVAQNSCFISNFFLNGPLSN